MFRVYSEADGRTVVWVVTLRDEGIKGWRDGRKNGDRNRQGDIVWWCCAHVPKETIRG